MAIQVLNELLINWVFERCRKTIPLSFRDSHFEACGEKLRLITRGEWRGCEEDVGVYYITVEGECEEIRWKVFNQGACGTLEVIDYLHGGAVEEIDMKEFLSSSAKITREEADHMQVLYPRTWRLLPWMGAGLSKMNSNPWVGVHFPAHG